MDVGKLWSLKKLRTATLWLLSGLLVGCANLSIHEKKMHYGRKGTLLSQAIKKGRFDAQHLIIPAYSDSVFPNEAITKFTRLERLTIRGKMDSKRRYERVYNELAVDTSKLWALKGLKYLDISEFAIDTFPKELLELRELQGLRVTICGVVHLPEDLGKLDQLSYLSFRLNSLTSLPRSLEAINSLQVLDLANNSFKAIPEPLFRLGGLQKLNLGNPEGSGDRIGRERHVETNNINFEDQGNRLTELMKRPAILMVHVEASNCRERNALRAIQGQVPNKRKLRMTCPACSDCTAIEELLNL